jgi:hypothetical protein
MKGHLTDRRSVLTGIGAAGASLLLASAEARLPEDGIKVVRYTRS